MKKKIMLLVIIMILLILFVPIPMKLKDGGSIEFRALLYTITKYHKLAPIEQNAEAKYIDGVGIKILGKEIYNNTNQIENKIKNKFNTSEITTTLTLEDEIQNDTIWCGTFQLIWNDLKNELAKQDIIFNPQLEVVKNLNKETFKTKDISDKYYYKKIGTPSLKLKEEIEKAIKEKFNETSDILDDFEWNGREPKDYFLYAMLKKEFQFEKAFEELELGKFGEYENIQYFGIEKDKTGQLSKQIEVLYYNSKDDFAIKLKTKQEDEIILCKKPEGSTFNEIYRNITQKEKKYEGRKSIGEGEKVKIPNIKLKEKQEFKEIQEKPFTFSNGDIYSIEKTIQTIEFELDKTGGKIKSEAGMMVKNESAIMLDETRNFLVDYTFAIFLKEKEKEIPYFAAKIDNITKFQ